MANESHLTIDGMKKLLSVAAHASYLFGFTYLLLPLVSYVYFNGERRFCGQSHQTSRAGPIGCLRTNCTPAMY